LELWPVGYTFSTVFTDSTPMILSIILVNMIVLLLVDSTNGCNDVSANSLKKYKIFASAVEHILDSPHFSGKRFLSMPNFSSNSFSGFMLNLPNTNIRQIWKKRVAQASADICSNILIWLELMMYLLSPLPMYYR
jgi:hypothetical protein